MLPSLVHHNAWKTCIDTCSAFSTLTSSWQKNPGTKTVSSSENWIPEKQNELSSSKTENWNEDSDYYNNELVSIKS